MAGRSAKDNSSRKCATNSTPMRRPYRSPSKSNRCASSKGSTPATVGRVPKLDTEAIGAAPIDSVSSFGTRPAVNGVEPLLEAHLFDFDGDLYGRRISVEFVAHLRDELNFPDLPALVEQIHRDARQARELLSSLSQQACA